MADVTARFGRRPHRVQRSTSFDRFQRLRAAGGGFGESVLAALQGREMTVAGAATRIQAAWRARVALARIRRARYAVVLIQAGCRGMATRRCLALETMNQQQVAGCLTSLSEQQMQVERDEKFRHFCATFLQAAWRGRQARLQYPRPKRPVVIRRTFSWSRNSRKGSGSASTPPVKPATSRPPQSPSGHSVVHGTSPVKRSSSFDRIASALRGGRSKSVNTPRRAETLHAEPRRSMSSQLKPQTWTQLLYISVMRGSNGSLGLELDPTNSIAYIVPGGAADLDGQLRVGDTIVSVDGVPLNGQLLQVVMIPTECHTFGIWRLARSEPEAPPVCGARRSQSFSRKK